MRESRARDARQKVGVLATCLGALCRGEDSMDSEVAEFVLAESLLMWRKSVTK